MRADRRGGGSGLDAAEVAQETRFCLAADGVRIAWARHGSGPPLVVSTCWLSHLQYDWRSPVWRHFLEDLGRVATVIRYDERGHGLSDREVTDHRLEMRVGDLAAVVEAAGCERFALMAMAQGGPVAITYAAQHPEAVTRMMFYNTFADAYPARTPEIEAMEAAFEQLISVGWDRPHSEFRRVFSAMMIPGGGEERQRWMDDLLRVSTSTDVAIGARREWNTTHTSDLLGELTMPTLVLHARHDRMINFEHGRRLASAIPGARLVTLDSDNHIVLADEPAWTIILDEVTAFLAPDRVARTTPGAAAAALSAREREVLELAADGLGNDDIAAQLVVSVRTVERHLQNTYTKLGVSGRSARAAAVAKLLSFDA
jgi:pimeloyl-ACP methyl ester carboxylesterase/DNA-binding CsgD family transcriptional regulator